MSNPKTERGRFNTESMYQSIYWLCWISLADDVNKKYYAWSFTCSLKKAFSTSSDNASVHDITSCLIAHCKAVYIHTSSSQFIMQLADEVLSQHAGAS